MQSKLRVVEEVERLLTSQASEIHTTYLKAIHEMYLKDYKSLSEAQASLCNSIACKLYPAYTLVESAHPEDANQALRMVLSCTACYNLLTQAEEVFNPLDNVKSKVSFTNIAFMSPEVLINNYPKFGWLAALDVREAFRDYLEALPLDYQNNRPYDVDHILRLSIR